MREVTPLGEWTLGRGTVSFVSRPIAQPHSTVRLKWGSGHVIVRVDEFEDGRSIGRVLAPVFSPSIDMDRDAFESFMEWHEWSTTAAARALGTSRHTIKRRLVRLGFSWKADTDRPRVRLPRSALVALYRANHMNTGPVEELLGVPYYTLRSAFRRKQILMRSGVRVVTLSAQGLAEMYVTRRMSLRAIASQFSVTPQAVWRWLRKAGIPRRPFVPPHHLKKLGSLDSPR